MSPLEIKLDASTALVKVLSDFTEELKIFNQNTQQPAENKEATVPVVEMPAPEKRKHTKKVPVVIDTDNEGNPRGTQAPGPVRFEGGENEPEIKTSAAEDFEDDFDFEDDEPEVQPSRDLVRQISDEKVRLGFRVEVATIVKTKGAASKISAIPEEKLAAVLKALKELKKA